MRLLDTYTGQTTSPESKQAWEEFAACALLPKPKYESSTWVKLVSPPTAFSFDEAWLLCQCSETQWLGWIPDYGEILLNTGDFY